MIEFVKVSRVKALDGSSLWVLFSNGMEGIRDFTDILDEGGPMVEPLRDPAMFRRVFVQCGVPAWPNGFDIDAIQLYMEMKDRRALAVKNSVELESGAQAEASSRTGKPCAS